MGRARRRKQLSKKLKEAPKFNGISEESLAKWQALFMEERQASAKEEVNYPTLISPKYSVGLKNPIFN